MASNKTPRVLPDLASLQALIAAQQAEIDRLKSSAPTDGVSASVNQYVSKKTGKAGENLRIAGVINGTTLYPVGLSKNACKAILLPHIMKAIKAYAESK